MSKMICLRSTLGISEMLWLGQITITYGILLKQGYKSTYGIDKILNYRMFERKIRFSEDIINSSDLMEKKVLWIFLLTHYNI